MKKQIRICSFEKSSNKKYLVANFVQKTQETRKGLKPKSKMLFKSATV